MKTTILNRTVLAAVIGSALAFGWGAPAGARERVQDASDAAQSRSGDDADERFPTKVSEHVRHVPAPWTRHHQHRRRREMCERAADGYVDEQQADRRVCKTW